MSARSSVPSSLAGHPARGEGSLHLNGTAANRCFLAALLRFLGLVFRRFAREDFGRTSASLAYTTLLSIAPLLAVVLGGMSAMPSFLSMADPLLQAIHTLLPERSAAQIVGYVLEFSQKALNVTLVGLLALALTILALLNTVEQTFDKIWKAPRKRAWWRRIVLYAALISLWPLAVAYVVAAVSFAVTLSAELVIEPAWLDGLLNGLLSRATAVLVSAVFFTGLYFAVPNAPVRLRHALAGGGFAAFGFLLMQRGFELYLSYFPSFTLVYGAFATIPIFLLWLYFSWAVILLGALVAAARPRWGWKGRLCWRRNPPNPKGERR